MLSKADNEFLTRSGPGTPMGDLLRRFWMPALLSEELPERDGPPKKIRILGEDLLAWMLVRFQVENIKVLLRGFLDHTPLVELRKCLVALPEELALDADALLSAGTLEKFVDRLPMGMPRKALRVALGKYRDQMRRFSLRRSDDRAGWRVSELAHRTDSEGRRN